MMGLLKKGEWFFSSFIEVDPFIHWLQTFAPHPQHRIALHYVVGCCLYPYLWRNKDQMRGRNVESAKCWVLCVQVVQ